MLDGQFIKEHMFSISVSTAVTAGNIPIASQNKTSVFVHSIRLALILTSKRHIVDRHILILMNPTEQDVFHIFLLIQQTL